MTRVYLHALGILNALGTDVAEVRKGMLAGVTAGMRRREDLVAGRAVRAGTVTADLPHLDPRLAAYDSRNNQLLTAALQQIRPAVDTAIARHGAARVGIVLGTSTSGIAEGERALATYLADGTLPREYDYRQQEISSPSEYLRRALGIRGPAWTVSTACTSSAKAFSSGRRLILGGLCDAVLVGGVDSLCRLTLNGFSALESVSQGLCNPFSKHRDGINIGEGAALFLMSREPGPVALLGIGESSDAYHISGPDPEGRGAELALRQALQQAGAAGVDYLNLHGTATPLNDAMESGVVQRVLGSDTPCSSTKPLVGHTLGAAGATEAAFCWMLLTDSGPVGLPPHVWDGIADPALARLELCSVGYAPRACRVVASNSFAFGGNNACLVLGELMHDYPPIAELLPHRDSAVLLDAVLEDTADGIRARTRIGRGHPYFVEGEGVPVWVGIELMAQAIAAHAGLAARRSQKPPNAGMLLGTRRFEAKAPWFREGTELEIRADREFGESGGIAACACSIVAGGETLVTATLIIIEIQEGVTP